MLGWWCHQCRGAGVTGVRVLVSPVSGCWCHRCRGACVTGVGVAVCSLVPCAYCYLCWIVLNILVPSRACQHELELNNLDQAKRIIATFLSDNPSSITMWKVYHSLTNSFVRVFFFYFLGFDVKP